MNTIRLRAGTPDDYNRDYLPEEIKGSDIVVNENGNNSQPYPEHLKEFHGELVQGQENTWYEYVPEKYDGSKPVPLVISNHGGLMNGWGQCIYSSWSLLADREGFIVVYPTSTIPGFWQIVMPDDDQGEKIIDNRPVPEPERDMSKNPDMQFLLKLIEHMEKKYNIDKGRIFMQGMSMGNMMTSQFAHYYGYLLAGAAGSAGAGPLGVVFDQDGELINEGGPLAIWETRPENNGFGVRTHQKEAELDKYNRFYWMKINECDPIPEISIVGEDNFAFYKGGKADLVYLDVKNRDHGQTLDEAFLYWDYLFSGTHRDPDGKIVHEKTRIPRRGDSYAAAFEPGVAKVWWHNEVQNLSQAPVRWQKLKYHGLNGGQKVRGEYTMVPVQFLAEMAGGEYLPSEDTLTAEIRLPDGRVCQFARGSIGCLTDNTLRSMYCEALHRNGELLVSVEWFARSILGLQVSTCNDVVYVTDHWAELSYICADLIRDIFSGFTMPDDFTHLEHIKFFGDPEEAED